MSVAAPVAHMGSGNFLADEGVADVDDFRLRTMLCGHLATIIEQSGWTRALAAERIGMTQSDISRIVNCRFDDYSIVSTRRGPPCGKAFRRSAFHARLTGNGCRQRCWRVFYGRWDLCPPPPLER